MSTLISQTKEWKDLGAHYQEMKNVQMQELFSETTTSSSRFNSFSISFNGILFDYSKNIINKQTLDLLTKLAETSNLKAKIDAMFVGVPINSTEKRAVLHTALRSQDTSPIYVNGKDIVPDILKVLQQMETFVNKVHAARHLGATGKKITDIVNIGIGGSDLGPAMVCEALKYYSTKGINSHFVSNVDGTDIISTCKQLDPETTLFIIASKTFTTQETMANAAFARQWIVEALGNTEVVIAQHFVALSTNIEECKKFGINGENIFAFWDWVGGRYSLWSAIGLSIALSVGMNNFRELLQGAYEMDCHFRDTAFTHNIPVIMGLLGIWYHNFFDVKTHCVIPYDQYLKRFPAFLQQMDMESNGKYITKDNQMVEYSTGPVLWGEIGTNAQHSFFQLIHQGTHIIPIDFIAAVDNVNNDSEQHRILLSNFFAQTEALMKGKTESEVIEELKQIGKTESEIEDILPHKVFKGNRPTNTILLEKITPKSLGMLIAMYEHKVFVQGAIWNINQFDQWGVELGKQLAKKILPELKSTKIVSSHDSSTNGLINYFREKSKI